MKDGISAMYGNFEVSVIEGYVRISESHYIVEPNEPDARTKTALFVYAFTQGMDYYRNDLKRVLGVS